MTQPTRPFGTSTATATVAPELPLNMHEAETFRPRGALVTTMLVGPALALLGMLAAAAILRGMSPAVATILIALAGALVVMWIVLVIGLARVLLTTVRASSEGIEAQAPWDERRLLRWKYVDLVERRLGFLRLQTSDGTSLVLLENGLTDGQRLLRQILLRVSPTVLSNALVQELAMMGGAPVDPDAEQLLTISPVWFAVTSGVALAGIALSLWGEFVHILGLLIAGIVILGFCVVALVIFRQTITITERSMTLAHGFGRPQTVAWTDIAVIETMPLEMALTFGTNKGRLLFLGPFFMAPLRADLWRSTVEVFVTSRGIPVYERWRVF